MELGKPDAARFSGPLSPEYESAAESAAWANDFQRLGFLDGPGASQRSDIGPLASAALNYPAAWQEDFLRQQEDAKYQQACQEFDQAHFVPSGSENDGIRFKQLTGYEALRPIHSQPTSQQMQGTQQPVAQLPDEASFEQAFEAARLELEKQELAMQSQLNSVDSDLNPPSNPVVEQHAQHEPAEVNVKIGADTIDDDREREVEHREIEDDLARTAGQLLESVKDDHGKKFRESSFLELMRDLRDRRRTLTYIRKPADPVRRLLSRLVHGEANLNSHRPRGFMSLLLLSQPNALIDGSGAKVEIRQMDAYEILPQIWQSRSSSDKK